MVIIKSIWDCGNSNPNHQPSEHLLQLYILGLGEERKEKLKSLSPVLSLLPHYRRKISLLFLLAVHGIYGFFLHSSGEPSSSTRYR
jgi:hypothetical protein